MILLRKLFPLFLISAFLFTGCQKEDIVSTEVIPEEVVPTTEVVNGLMTRSTDMAEGVELVCLTVEYPFSVLLLDSTTAEILEDGDLELLLMDEDNYPVDFVYPLTVSDEDGNTSTVNDADELADLFADCVPDIGWGDDFPEWFFPAWVISFDYSCYQLVYPVILLDFDSVEVVANDEEELVEFLADGNLYSFAFPLSLENEDGEVVSADEPEGLFDLLSECYPDYHGGCGIGSFGCYEISYPATLVLTDGSTVVVENDDEFAEVFLSGDWAGFEYPLTLMDEDGNEITVDSEEELDALLLECFGGFGGGGEGILGCYEIQFPVTIILSDSTTAVVEDVAEFEELIFSGGFIGFEYPMTVIDEDGESIVVNSDEELEELLDDCFGGGPGGEFEGDFICYDIQFPIEVFDFNGSTVEISDSEEWAEYLINGGLGGFVYPITLLDIETGDETVVNDDFELIEAIEECW